MGVSSSLSLDAIYFIYYFICILLFCFHIVFLMTINTFELNNWKLNWNYTFCTKNVQQNTSNIDWLIDWWFYSPHIDDAQFVISLYTWATSMSDQWQLPWMIPQRLHEKHRLFSSDDQHIVSLGRCGLQTCAVSSKHWTYILVQVTIYRRLRIGRDGHLDKSEAYNIA